MNGEGDALFQETVLQSPGSRSGQGIYLLGKNAVCGGVVTCYKCHPEAMIHN
jgi:hypothetical protein